MRQLSIALQGDKSPSAYAALSARVERYGFDTLSIYADLGFHPAIVPLTLMARQTSRIRLGPASLNPTLLHPVEIAGQIAALDLVSSGRAYLGLVQGAWLDRLGLEESRPLSSLREAVEVVRRLLAGDRSGFAGERFTLGPGAGLNYEPLRREVPLMIGTWGPRTAAFAGTVAQEVKLGGCANPDMVRLAREWIGNDDVGVVVGAVTVVDEDGDAARARAGAEVQLYLPVIAHRDPTLELRPGQEPPLDRFVLAGTPAEVADHARSLFEAGASRVEFGTPQGLTTAGGVDLLVRNVVPLLHG